MKTAIKTQSKSMASILAAGAFILGCVAIGGAQAAEAPQSLTQVIAYGDLNLDSDQGAKVLYSRLRHAARNVCLPLEGRDLVQKNLWQSCFDNAVASAVVQINRSSVTALHNQIVNHSTKG
jgi:UrcA family protein